LFFFEKKNQKTFATGPNSSRILRHPCAAPVAKVFASFFKKKRFLASAQPFWQSSRVTLGRYQCQTTWRGCAWLAPKASGLSRISA
jgi:hypothetical protein